MFGEPMQSTNEKVQPHKNDVADWLNGLSLEQYINNVMENGFDSVDKYLRVSRQDLVKMGINDVCHRDKIISSLKDFESNC
jgi:hypothetical protein